MTASPGTVLLSVVGIAWDGESVQVKGMAEACIFQQEDGAAGREDGPFMGKVCRPCMERSCITLLAFLWPEPCYVSLRTSREAGNGNVVQLCPFTGTKSGFGES